MAHMTRSNPITGPTSSSIHSVCVSLSLDDIYTFPAEQQDCSRNSFLEKERPCSRCISTPTYPPFYSIRITGAPGSNYQFVPRHDRLKIRLGAGARERIITPREKEEEEEEEEQVHHQRLSLNLDELGDYMPGH